MESKAKEPLVGASGSFHSHPRVTREETSL
jgi:hypothetical protein